MITMPIPTYTKTRPARVVFAPSLTGSVSKGFYVHLRTKTLGPFQTLAEAGLVRSEHTIIETI